MSFGDYHYDLERCRDLLEEERYAEAFELASELLEQAPDEVEVVSVFADAALAAGNAAEAIRACRRCLGASGPDVELLEWLARGQWDLHLTEACLSTCLRLLRNDPGNYTAVDFGLAGCLELLDFGSAEPILEAAREHFADDRHIVYQGAVVRMMRADEKKGDEQYALATLGRHLDREPDEPGTYINLMRIHHLAGRYDRVEELFEQATERGLSHEDIHFNMGLALKARERDREAARYFLRAVRLNPEIPDAHFHLGQILRGEGHPLLGLWMLQRELSVDDTHPPVHAEMAWCAEDLEDYPAAVRMIRAAVERAPDWGVYLHSLAELLMKSGDESEEPFEIATRAVELTPGHAAGWQVLGRLAARRGEMALAEDCLRRSIAAEDTTAEDEGWLGLLLAHMGREDDARPFLERAARTFPFWDPVADALGRIRGHPLPRRFEVRITGSDPAGARWFRVLHVVAPDEAGARREAGAPGETDAEVRALGFDVDHEPGVVWDSGPSERPGLGPDGSR